MSFYSRVVSGDYAIAAQQRVARIKADKSGVDAGLAHLRGIRSRPSDSSGPQVVMARAGLLTSFDETRRAVEVLDEGLAQYPDVLRPAHGARLCLRA